MSTNLQDLIKSYYSEWIRREKYVMPNLTDALDFMATEVAEAIDKRLRLYSYVRNNEEAKPTNAEIAEEIFDTIMMGCVALDILNQDLYKVAFKKLEKMDNKRKNESK